MHVLKKRRLSAAALLAAAGIAAYGASMISTDVASANVPASPSVNCTASDGKISGRGSTYQTIIMGDWWNDFASDVCGNVADQYSGDPGGTDMGAYNYPSTSAGSGFTGSGNGQKAANCRTDAYAGTDIPYSEAQLNGLDGTPGNSVIGGCSTFPTLPYTPQSSTFPEAADTTSPLMSFPIAGSSVALEINLTAAECGGTLPSIKLTASQVDNIFGGNVANWSSIISSCNEPITRVVREDNSGTTNIFKLYLGRVDNSRTGATCDPSLTWTAANVSPNTDWPSGSGCTPVTSATTSGGPALLSTLESTPGGIGYADLADADASTVSGLIQATVQNAAGTSYTSPASGKGANCTYSSLTLPGFSSSDAVGLNLTDNWGNDNATVNGPTYGSIDHVNATDLGTQYPICGLTFDLVYSGLSAGPSGASAITGLTADQRRTLYSFFTYVLSSTAQEKLSSLYYAALPSLWIPTLQEGFQANF